MPRLEKTCIHQIDEKLKQALLDKALTNEEKRLEAMSKFDLEKKLEEWKRQALIEDQDLRAKMVERLSSKDKPYLVGFLLGVQWWQSD